jgi:hypothetical protein
VSSSCPPPLRSLTLLRVALLPLHCALYFLLCITLLYAPSLLRIVCGFADVRCYLPTQDLERLLGSLTQVLPQLELRHAMSSVACLIKHMDLMSDASGFGQYKMESLDLSQYLRLDAAAVRALDLV